MGQMVSVNDMPGGIDHKVCKGIAETMQRDVLRTAIQNIKLLSYLEMAQYLNNSSNLREMVRNMLAQMKLITGANKVYFLKKNSENNTQQLFRLKSDGSISEELLSMKQIERLSEFLLLKDISKPAVFQVRDVMKRSWHFNETIETRISRKYILLAHAAAFREQVGIFIAVGDRHLEIFEHNDRLILEAVMEQIAMAILNSKLQGLSFHDSLTGLFVRRILDDRFREESARYERTKRAFSMILLDLDDFKKINDEYGHPEGDFVLSEIAQVFRKLLRDMDVPVRMGGEEFAFLLPETSIAGAMLVAERLNSAIYSAFSEKPYSVTASIGVCEFESGSQFQDIYKACDVALYKAKLAGKNRVEKGSV